MPVFQGVALFMTDGLRIGIDLGGTKIEGLALDGAGQERARLRIDSPQGDYGETIRAIVGVVARLEADIGAKASVGIGMPGSLSPTTGLARNANSTWLNGRPLGQDVSDALGRPVRFANDANCFALSEAVDGAGRDAHSVFGIILGTGCGGGIVIEKRLIEGARGIGGEWGHNPLPWPAREEMPGPRCWCGRHGCLETWISGPGLAADHERINGVLLSAQAIAKLAKGGDEAAQATLNRHADRVGRALAHVINIIDPEVIVIGGGLSHLAHLYAELPALAAPHVFSDEARVTVLPPKWGDAGGVRGAAWLWNDATP
jgi:fructokinase